ncbi:carboxypeptidase M32 [Paenibacillus pasadenensis]|uniref:carboxypeptidase M32 n=1 Tax=Paenibacillus pasadenensis TaxID=217090 RepID=UPI00203DE4AD|nr:carboxypeptidase M32 [Paenibacillus pasadenensis]MCM3748992.1 carboxypeptidase M32 [Paenibacillus pasadenensis]
MAETSSTYEKALQEFRELDRKICRYNEAASLLNWDMRTGAPRKGLDGRSEVIGMLASEAFLLATSPRTGELLEQLEEPGTEGRLSEIDRKLVSETRKTYDRSVKIPPKLYEEYVVLASQSESAWEEARANNDYAAFQGYLDRIIGYTNQFIDLWGPKETRYDTLLDDYEPGMTVAELDGIFNSLRGELVPLASAIAESSNKPDRDFLQGHFDKEKQKEFSRYMLEQLGFDFEAGRIDESMHPFQTTINLQDVRITTRYLPEDVTSALFGTIHEAGHAMYEQNVTPELAGTSLCRGTSMGIHESQSRFWENTIGRSRPFWQRYYGDLQSRFPEQLKVSAEQFYRSQNTVQPSLIRIEADELTYNLHIIIRYEIEKMIFNGGAKAADLPAIWNEKYREYLGLTPPTDADGVLQDVHWSAGLFGYFPSYSLGNMYAAQMADTMERQLPNMWELVARGELASIREWLTQNVHRHGKLLTPKEIILGATGKPLDSSYLVKYLKDKYTDIYKL